MGKRDGERVTPPAPVSGAQGREADEGAARRHARPIRLVCPVCGTVLRVYEDEVGQSGACPGCGAGITVPAEALASAQAGAADSPEGPVVRAVLVRPASGSASAAQRNPAAPAPVQAVGPATPRADARSASPRPVGRIDYAIWQILVDEAGDTAMAARLDALRRAEEAGCALTIIVPDGSQQPFPEMVLCEATVAALAGEAEAGWRQEWTRRLVRVAAKWQDEGTFEGVVALLAHVDAIIADLRSAGVWPWLATAKS